MLTPWSILLADGERGDVNAKRKELAGNIFLFCLLEKVHTDENVPKNHFILLHKIQFQNTVILSLISVGMILLYHMVFNCKSFLYLEFSLQFSRQ